MVKLNLSPLLSFVSNTSSLGFPFHGERGVLANLCLACAHVVLARAINGGKAKRKKLSSSSQGSFRNLSTRFNLTFPVKPIKYRVSSRASDLNSEGRACILILDAHTARHKTTPSCNWPSSLCSPESCASPSNHPGSDLSPFADWHFQLVLLSFLFLETSCMNDAHSPLSTHVILRDHFENTCQAAQKVKSNVSKDRKLVYKSALSSKEPQRWMKTRGTVVATSALASENCLNLETLSWRRSGGKVRTPCPA